MATVLAHHPYDMTFGLIAMLTAVLCSAFTIFKLIFDRQYLVDMWNQTGLLANALFVFASVFAFFITLIFIYETSQMIKSKIVQSMNRREDE